MTDSDSHDHNPSISTLEQKAVLCFSDVAECFHVPRFIGGVFALIYVARSPIGVLAIQSRLKISTYVTRTSVDYLLRIGLVQKVYGNPQERIAYIPEPSPEIVIQKWAGNVVHNHLLKACSHLQGIESVLHEDWIHQDELGSLKSRADALVQWKQNIDAGQIPFSHDGQGPGSSTV